MAKEIKILRPTGALSMRNMKGATSYLSSIIIICMIPCLVKLKKVES